jgi:hypothetical protein
MLLKIEYYLVDIRIEYYYTVISVIIIIIIIIIPLFRSPSRMSYFFSFPVRLTHITNTGIGIGNILRHVCCVYTIHLFVRIV